MIKIEWQPLPPASGGEEVSYFPRLKGNGSVDVDTLSKQAVKHQTVFSRGELLAAFDHLQREMTDAFASGKAVKIPGFGTSATPCPRQPNNALLHVCTMPTHDEKMAL